MTAWLIPLLLAATPLEVEPWRGALIVGVNIPFDGAQATLRYADDDAARYAEILSAQAESLELLTILDADSHDMFPVEAARARTPSRAGLRKALDRLGSAAEAARATGRKAELMFVYVGHGRVRGGEGEVRLLDGVLTRPELAEWVMADPRFDRKHLIVDACNAYHLVNARGEDDVKTDLEAAFEDYLRGQTVERYPSVGVVLSTSGAGNTHEWSRYRGGLFSHEIRSALAGAADADRNGRINYAEVEAFVAAANLDVPKLSGQPTVFVRPPAIEREAVLGTLSAPRPSIELPASVRGRFVLVDDRGLPYAELHKAAGAAVQIQLVPRNTYQLRDQSGAQVFAWQSAMGQTQVPLPLVASALAQPRSEEGPPGLFARPFAAEFVAGYEAKRNRRLAEQQALFEQSTGPSKTKIWVGAGAAAALGGVATGVALWQRSVANATLRRQVDSFDKPEKERLTAQTRRERTRSVGIGVAAGTLLATSAGLALWAYLAD